MNIQAAFVSLLGENDGEILDRRHSVVLFKVLGLFVLILSSFSNVLSFPYYIILIPKRFLILLS